MTMEQRWTFFQLPSPWAPKKNNNAFIEALQKDGLIDGRNFSIQLDKNLFRINGKEQPLSCWKNISPC